MFKRNIIETQDGSSSIYVEEMNEQYHSIHGAVQESQHVFIKNGFSLCNKNTISILEIGFGTGLNVLLTYLEAQKVSKSVYFYSLEKYPLLQNEYENLHYSDIDNGSELLFVMHNCEWEKQIELSPFFYLYKTNTDLLNWLPNQQFDLVYFDAFSPDKQPHLWTEDVFKKIFNSMNDGGILSTYCAKGQVKRNLKASGFVVESKPGPKGKREITVARKLGNI